MGATLASVEQRSMDEHGKRNDNDQDGEGHGEKRGEELEGTTATREFVALLFFLFFEAGKLVAQRHFQRGFIPERGGEPVGLVGVPGGGQTFQGVGVGGDKTILLPERGGFAGPEAGEAVVGGEGLDAFPQLLAQEIGEAEVVEGLTMASTMSSDDFQTDSAKEFALFGFRHLEFGEPTLQFGRREMHCLPERTQGRKVIHGGTTDTISG